MAFESTRKSSRRFLRPECDDGTPTHSQTGHLVVQGTKASEGRLVHSRDPREAEGDERTIESGSEVSTIGGIERRVHLMLESRQFTFLGRAERCEGSDHAGS